MEFTPEGSIPLNVYFASDFGRAPEVRTLAEACERDKLIRVVSRWHREVNNAEASSGMGGPEDGEVARLAAERNLSDIDACDVFILLTSGSPGRGGRHFETGYAVARGKRTVIAGPREHAFHRLPGLIAIPAEDIVGWLARQSKSR